MSTRSTAAPALSAGERERYSRQMMVAGWGEAGQEKLRRSTVLVVGVGGLGCPVATYLTAAGVGTLRLCDVDCVDLSNLNRQVLYSAEDVGCPKAHVAASRLRQLNPWIEVVDLIARVDAANIASLAGEAQVVLDCLDNFPTRYLLNEYCLGRGVPLVHGAVWGLGGQVTFLQPPRTPCLRCIFPEPPPASTFPVVGAAPGLVGCLQALETLKFLTGVGENAGGRLHLFDGEDLEWHAFRIRRDPCCPVCSCLGDQATRA